MTVRPEIVLAIVVMAIAAYCCRASGFFLMRYVTITPRLRTALQALPMALVMSVISVGAVKGNVPEWLGLATAFGIMATWRSETAAIVLSVAVVGLSRALL
ncbi:MAG: hypothetical protein RLZ98_1369 [Pseudomonadota bacterium]|jgi:uncharacterized membrane protein